MIDLWLISLYRMIDVLRKQITNWSQKQRHLCIPSSTCEVYTDNLWFSGHSDVTVATKDDKSLKMGCIIHSIIPLYWCADAYRWMYNKRFMVKGLISRDAVICMYVCVIAIYPGMYRKSSIWTPGLNWFHGLKSPGFKSREGWNRDSIRVGSINLAG